MESGDFSARPLSVYESYVSVEQQLSVLTSSLPDHISPTCVTSVWNMNLWHRYHQQKQEYLQRRANVQEMLLWHATDECNVESILTNNFQCSRAERSRYGFGVCFSKDAAYANLHCNKKNGNRRALIATIVLVGKVCVGFPTMTLPLPTCDTSVGRRGLVYVKFGRDEFYPALVVYYEHDDESPTDISFESMANSSIRCETDRFYGFKVCPSSNPEPVNFSSDAIIERGTITEQRLVSFPVDNDRFNLQAFSNLYCDTVNNYVNNLVQNVRYGNANNTFHNSTNLLPHRYDVYNNVNNGCQQLSRYNSSDNNNSGFYTGASQLPYMYDESNKENNSFYTDPCLSPYTYDESNKENNSFYTDPCLSPYTYYGYGHQNNSIGYDNNCGVIQRRGTTIDKTYKGKRKRRSFEETKSYSHLNKRLRL